MLIIPAIDLLGGKCVRLTKGDYGTSREYSEDPAAVASKFGACGVEWIHVVDLDGARSGSPQNTDAVRRLLAVSGAPVQVGGGIRDEASVEAYLALGVARCVLGSVLARDAGLAERLFKRFGEKVVAGIDSRNGRVAVSGWTETSEMSTLEFVLRMQEAGAQRFICTDIDRDGMLNGPNLEFLSELTTALASPVLASGGVSGIQDLEALAGLRPEVEGVIVGKALYEGRLDLREAVAKFGPKVPEGRFPAI